MSTRRLALLVLLVLACLVGPAVPVAAQEEPVGTETPVETGPPPTVDEVTKNNPVAREYRPEPYVPPSFTPWLLYPLLAAGALAALLILFFYLAWQPRFASEARRKSRGRRR
ncbi:MAG: hypothetical protein M3N17_03765 [Actinomycetota bacterium]|nr:hypothetical protein [Actinomycetota bacterium]